MEQYNKIVLEAPEGMHYTTSQGKNGALVVRLVPNEQGTRQGNVAQSRATRSQGKATQERTACSQGEAVQESTDKAKYFTKISAKDREKVKKWLASQENAPEWATEFLRIVRKSVKEVNYDYWIANLEPSVKDGKIYYAEGKDVGVGFSAKDWEKMAEEYAHERDSRQSNLSELFIWYALRIADGLWTLEYVAKDSSSAGNFWDAPNSTIDREKTGARMCGGYCDGQGNTIKIVTVEGGYALVGGDYYRYGYCYPVAYLGYCDYPYFIEDDSCGVVVLTK